MDLARRYLAPPRRGLEIGRSSTNAFDGVEAWNLDHPALEVFQASQRVRAGEIAAIDVFGDADALPFADRSLDFVLTSHVLEHMPDTLAALREWSRVVVDGGTVFAIVPHKDRTFDADRPCTELEHHLADWALGTTAASAPLVPTSHYHVWRTENVVELVEAANRWGALDWRIEAVEDVDSKVGNGFTIVARKISQPPLPAPAAEAAIAFWFLTLDVPFQVALRTTEYVVRCADPTDADLPRGRYRAVPIHAGVAPRAGAPRIVELGAPLGAPVLERVAIEDGLLRFEGARLDAACWIEAEFDGVLQRALPRFRAGALELDAGGIAFPRSSFPARVVSLPPGGGTSDTIEVTAHLDPS